MSYIKIKDMCMPGNCASCPLLILSAWGNRSCFVTEENIQDWRLDERSANCPLEESED